MDTNRPAKTPLQRDIDSGAYAAQEEKTMTTHPQHTSTPDCEDCKAVSSGHSRKHYCEKHTPNEYDGKWITAVMHESTRTPKEVASFAGPNAGYVLRAISAHEDMLAEIKAQLSMLNSIICPKPTEDIERLRAIIKKAEAVS